MPKRQTAGHAKPALLAFSHRFAALMRQQLWVPSVVNCRHQLESGALLLKRRLASDARPVDTRSSRERYDAELAQQADRASLWVPRLRAYKRASVARLVAMLRKPGSHRVGAVQQANTKGCEGGGTVSRLGRA